MKKTILVTHKDYQQWMGVKTSINNRGKTLEINEGDIVWVAVGENVGVEIDGKSDKYSRPVIILKKHSKRCFTGIPLTTKLHLGSWYKQFVFQGRDENAVLIQTRLFDISRVYCRIGRLSKKDYEAIRESYIRLFQQNMP